MNGRRILSVAVLAAASGVWCGCNPERQTVDTSSGAPRAVDAVPDLVAQSTPPIADVPLPAKFKLNEDGSWSRINGGNRLIKHGYYGPSDKFATWRFYKKQMPVHQWTLMRDEYSDKVVVMDFDKANERCRITISDGSWLNPSRVLVEVYTVGATPTGR
jgi:hypothetical protein